MEHENPRLYQRVSREPIWTTLTKNISVLMLIFNMFMHLKLHYSIPICKPNSEKQVYILKKINQLTKSYNKAFLLEAKQNYTALISSSYTKKKSSHKQILSMFTQANYINILMKIKYATPGTLLL